MNQILSIKMPKEKRKKESNPVEIKTILKIFAIILLVFGISSVATGAYAFFSNQAKIKNENLDPSFSIENKSENVIIVKVTSPENISKMEYYWNNEESKTVNGNNGKYLEQEINVPSGTNTLHLIVEDVKGKQSTYDKEYNLKSNINFEVSGNKIKITYESEKNLSYMTYKWDDNEEKQININGNSVDEEIEAIKGLHQLTVSIVDEDNHTETTSKKINGVSKPTIKIDWDESAEHFIIKASDEEQLSKIQFTIDDNEEQIYELDIKDQNIKEYEYTLPDDFKIHDGDNILRVTVYNVNGVSESTGVRLTK